MTTDRPKRPLWQRILGNTIWVVLVLVALVSMLPKTDEQLAAESAAKLEAEKVAAAKIEAEQAAAKAAAEAAAATTAWREKAITAIRQEPRVADASWPNGNGPSLWITMRDDGTRRDGYAESMCLILGQNGMPAGDFIVIHIYDAAAMAREEFREIGRYDCAPK